MVKKLENKKKRGRPSSNLIANTPFAVNFSRVLDELGVKNSAIEAEHDLPNGTIRSVLTKGNPTIQTVWELEDALELPRGALCIPGTHPSNQVEKPRDVKAEGAPTSPSDMPESNALLPANIDEEKPVQRFRSPGRAAAFTGVDGRHGGFSEDTPEAWDSIVIPETTHFVQISGDSMAPLVMNGQYVMIGPEYMEGYTKPRNREVVLVHVLIQDEDQAGSDAPWEGVYCKRVQDGGDIWHFTSINTTGAPFTALKANCRIWPVVGVYFAGKGCIPEED